MPNSHFNASITGNGEYSVIQDAWDGFLEGLVASGVIIEGSVLQNSVDNPAPVPPPTITGDGEGYDAVAAIPDFTKEPGVTYRLKFTDDGAASFSDAGYEVEPNTPVTVANGWHLGRQFSIFADNVQGELTAPLY